MPSQGPSEAGTFTVTTDGLGATNPNNAKVDDGAYATISLSKLSGGDFLGLVSWTSFGFTIPTGSSIDGIEVLVQRYASGTGVSTSNAFLSGGSASSEDKADGNWPTSPASENAFYGGATDTWGLTWTAAEINAAAFGFTYSFFNFDFFSARDAFMDTCKITVHYTEGGAGGGGSQVQESTPIIVMFGL